MLEDLQSFSGKLKTTDNKPGAYVITHVGTGLLYVGSALKPAERISYHIYRLKNGLHSNKRLQRAYDEDNRLEWKYFLVGDREAAYSLEQSLIDHYYPKNKLFNISIYVKSPHKGRKLSPDHASKLTKSRLGKTNSSEHRKKISAALTGIKQSKERRQRSSEARKGKPVSETHQEHLRELGRKKQKQMMGDGVRYDGCRDCARKLKIHVCTVLHRINSKLPKYDGWYYLDT